ncbi:MAG: filamentous hemagglutinin N-terminal domain-containing protein, partial [Nitrospira defluvii]|nr:filamentous hemagglutinin N-terminal domain-containing protein [Nitrospira defluvii]
MNSSFLAGLADGGRPHFSAALLVCWLIQPFVPDMGHAQATSPITSSGLNTTVTKSGNVFDVTGGTRPGNGPNLFHSFGEFGVPTNHVANFLNNSGLATSNILGRVTGGNPSNIFGTIQTTGFGSANLFLMNPAGILFGPTASLNVGGSVSFTTADYLRLTDGARFNALPGPQDAAISSAPVAAFGFLGSNPGAITVQSSQLAVAEGQAISLVGGNIELRAGWLENGPSQSARLSAPGGQINLASVGSAGEVLPTGAAAAVTDPTLNGFTSLGNISLAQEAVITTSAHHAGRIVIRAGQFTMDDARLEASATATVQNSPPPASAAGGISVQADNVTLSHGSNVITSAIDGTAGNITFEVGTLRSNVGVDGTPLSGATPVTIASHSTGQGGAGSISIAGKAGGPADAVLLSNTHIVTGVSSAANPKVSPGNIEIGAQQIELANGTVMRADTTGGADAGAITLNVDTLKTEAGPEGRVLISSSSDCGDGCFGGQAGDITIQGIQGVTPTVTRKYVFIGTPTNEPSDPLTYHLARQIDLQGTDIRSEAIGNAPGGQVMMRSEGQVSFTDSTVSVATQDFDIEVEPVTPSGQPARNQGFSRIDIMAQDVVLKDSTIKADAEVSEPGSCPTCTGGPAAGEIWFRVENSLTAENSSILNTGRGRAQSGITKIVKDNYFSFGAIWEPEFPDLSTNTVKLTNSEITVEARDVGLPGILRIRSHDIELDHSVLNSEVNDVSNFKEPDGR